MPAEHWIHLKTTNPIDAWADFLRGLTGRGLTPPLLVVSDGAPGLIGAAEVVLARSLRQRCLIHRARNILAKVPAGAQAEVKAEFWKLFDDIEHERGQAAVNEARRRIALFEKRYTSVYPAAVKCLLDDVESLTVYLRFPKEHWKRIRHSNFILAAMAWRSPSADEMLGGGCRAWSPSLCCS
jgi:transposase-like protein